MVTSFGEEDRCSLLPNALRVSGSARAYIQACGLDNLQGGLVNAADYYKAVQVLSLFSVERTKRCEANFKDGRLPTLVMRSRH